MPRLQTLRISRSLGVGAAALTKVRRHGTSSAAADTDADAAAYSREDLGAAGLAACSRGLPRLAVLLEALPLVERSRRTGAGA